MNILEAKLSMEHRKDLSDSDFGLPKERKYPLNDESHVRSAIIYFKYCKPEQRRELAKNINLKLKKFDMKVKVGEKNPFYKYIDKKYLAESFAPVNESLSFSYKKGTNPNNKYDQYICKLISQSDFYVDESFIINAEKEVYKILHTTTDNNENLLLFLYNINNIFEIIYTEYFNYHKYINAKISVTSWYYPLVNDFRKTFMMKITSTNMVIDISKEQTLYLEFLGKVLKHKFDHNWYYIYRINSEIYYRILSQMGRGIEFQNLDLNIYTPEIVRDLKTIMIEFREWYTDNLPLDDRFMHWEAVRDLLIEHKKQLEEELYIITANDTIKPLSTKQKMHSLYYIKNESICDKIDTIAVLMDKSNKFFNIIKNITFTITQEDEVRLLHTKYIDSIISSKFDQGKIYWFGIKDDNLYLICKPTPMDKMTYKLVLIDDMCVDYLKYSDTSKPKIKIITITFPTVGNNIDYNLEQVTEGLYINKNGDIKITINPKKSYMDEYAEAHRILVENHKNKNYEAMKQNVAFMFLLISVIERDKKYKDRDKDIVKARAFAINDFKTYLSYIQKEEPSFNFEKYYKDSEFDKYVINIPVETISGIKVLLKTILS